MDDLEEYLEQSGDLEESFSRAASYMQSIASTLSSDKLLYFYARYKQANEGPCNNPKPGFFDFKGKQKWDAWKALGILSKEDAMKEYVNGISEVDPNWQLKVLSEDGQMASGGSWVKVSSLAKQKDAKEDCDKNHFDWVKENCIDKVKGVSQEILMKKDENGMSLLHWAADRGYSSMITVLIEMGINVNVQDEDGQTALHYAAFCGHPEVVKILLANGADVTIVDSDGQLALDCADDDIRVIFD